jgi:ATP-dependent exoDNAse (exonuclease V) beta subunit
MNDESEEPYQNEGTSNETPSFIDGQIDSTNQAQVTQYWIDYKNNWISHNQGELDKEYEVWV